MRSPKPETVVAHKVPPLSSAVIGEVANEARHPCLHCLVTQIINARPGASANQVIADLLTAIADCIAGMPTPAHRARIIGHCSAYLPALVAEAVADRAALGLPPHRDMTGRDSK